MGEEDAGGTTARERGWKGRVETLCLLPISN